MLNHVWIIPALPALSFVLILAFGRRLPDKGSSLGVLAVAVAFVLALVTAYQWNARETAHSEAGGFDDVPAECSDRVTEIREGEHSEDAVGGENSDDGADGDHADGAVAAQPTTGEVASAAAPMSGAAVAAEEGAEEHFTRPVVRCTHWFSSNDTDISVGTFLDGQSALLLVIVTFISLLVHIYSTDYLDGDRRYTHYFAFLSLFTASMLFFVLSENTLQMIVGWELVGVCSFALIGHWWEEQANSDAALKAFFTNRVGDVGLLVGVITLYFGAGRTFSIIDINVWANSEGASHTLLLVSACCLTLAVMSKSGQFILHTWLPDAMAGPTPVSALIHAATMVVAGIYMVARLYPVFWHGLSIGGSSINLLAVVGSVTAVFGAALAFVQKDIKKVLAYSTISQLGFMVTALGVGAYTAALFHLTTHAIFKACLFLGAGSLSHACHHSFNMVDDMGGLRKVMPRTFWTFLIATFALAGIPPLAGFWSKDEILAGTGGFPGTEGANGTYYFAVVALIIGAMFTAAYMGRAIWYAFFGEYRGHGEPHESGPRITIPLMVLGGLSVVAGFANFPFGGESIKLRFEHFVEPVGRYFPGYEAGFGHAEFYFLLAIVATVGAVLALVYVYFYYWRDAFSSFHGLASRNRFAGGVKHLLEQKYYFDWLYTDVIVGFVKGPLARATNWFNQVVIDGIVNGIGRNAAAAGRWVYTKLDQGVVDGAVNGIGSLTEGAGGELRQIQTGRVQQYAALFFAAAALLAGVVVVAVGG